VRGGRSPSYRSARRAQGPVIARHGGRGAAGAQLCPLFCGNALPQVPWRIRFVRSA
jgi:hypothetical protein